MKLHGITISPKTFAQLSESEQLLFLRVSHVHDDLRYIRQLVVVAHNGVKALTGTEAEVARHQLLFAVKLWCGSLTEAVDAVRFTANGITAKQLHDAIPPDAQKEGKAFRRYFSKENMIEKIRNWFAFHYDAQPILKVLCDGVNIDALSVVLGGSQFDARFNVFYTFAEQVRSAALLRLVGGEDFETASERLVRHIAKVHNWFITFSEELLAAILQKCEMRSEEITTTCVVDPQTVAPIIFVDEDAIIEGLKNRGVKL